MHRNLITLRRRRPIKLFVEGVVFSFVLLVIVIDERPKKPIVTDNKLHARWHAVGQNRIFLSKVSACCCSSWCVGVRVYAASIRPSLVYRKYVKHSDWMTKKQSPKSLSLSLLWRALIRSEVWTASSWVTSTNSSSQSACRIVGYVVSLRLYPVSLLYIRAAFPTFSRIRFHKNWGLLIVLRAPDIDSLASLIATTYKRDR